MATKYALLLSVAACFSALAIPRINLFRPSDRFLMPEPVVPCWGGQFSIGYEGAFHIRGFQDIDEYASQVCINDPAEGEKKVNVLQIFQDTQDGLAGLKGFSSETRPGQFSQLFNINDENGKQGLFLPCGTLKIPLNLMFSQRFYFSYGFSVALHLPVYTMELKDVRFIMLNNAVTVEQQLEQNFLTTLREISNLDFCGWRRTGIGDLVAQITWMKNFPQSRPLLCNVRPQARLGLIFPIGKRQDENKILAIPFGTDGSWGVQFAGGLDLTFSDYLRGGIDVEFVYLFGNERCRRVKTALNQTDLFFVQKVPGFKEFGLGQQYNIYLEAYNPWWRGFSCKFNYQFLKQNEDRLDIGSDLVDATIVNSAEELQDWTVHSIIIGPKYEFWRDCPDWPISPSILGWVKIGFNGKRAFVANTVGLQLSIAF